RDPLHGFATLWAGCWPELLFNTKRLAEIERDRRGFPENGSVVHEHRNLCVWIDLLELRLLLITTLANVQRDDLVRRAELFEDVVGDGRCGMWGAVENEAHWGVLSFRFFAAASTLGRLSRLRRPS